MDRRRLTSTPTRSSVAGSCHLRDDNRATWSIMRRSQRRRSPFWVSVVRTFPHPLLSVYFLVRCIRRCLLLEPFGGSSTVTHGGISSILQDFHHHLRRPQNRAPISPTAELTPWQCSCSSAQNNVWVQSTLNRTSHRTPRTNPSVPAWPGCRQDRSGTMHDCDPRHFGVNVDFPPPV